jgi:hypothetical protein
VKKKIIAAILAFLPSITFAGGGGDAGDFGDGIVLSLVRPVEPPIFFFRRCWDEYQPTILFNGFYWVVQWVRIERCE